ncbi:hypothetical protein ACTTBA_04210 [Shewanella frigidimarina]|uniref:hypothetical protein n=1 Tax=Shewanella frigidimarina TaxID=56812 RepID=UPI003FA1565E
MTPELSGASIGAAAVITAALISLIVAVTSAVIAKEQKVSEFRQVWIENLRNDIAEVVSLSYSFIVEKEKAKSFNVLMKQQDYDQAVHNSQLECSRKSMDIMGNILKTSILIKLRLNPKEHMLILNAVKLLINNLQKEKTDIRTSFLDLDEVQALSHEVLKSEWEKVKKGEKHFVNFRDFGELCLFAFITAFFILLAAVKFPEYFPGMFN